MLRDRCLVHEETVGAQHAGNFSQRRPRAFLAAAHVIAGAKIDHEIEASRFEWKVANVGLEQSRVDAERSHSLLCSLEQGRIDVHAKQLGRCKTFREYWKRHATPASDLQNAPTTWQLKRAQQ
jgi:hypothetical protein